MNRENDQSYILRLEEKKERYEPPLKNASQDETYHRPTLRANKLTAPLEDYMDGPTKLNSDDPRLLDYIRSYFFLQPKHYEVRESHEAEFTQPLRNKFVNSAETIPQN